MLVLGLGLRLGLGLGVRVRVRVRVNLEGDPASEDNGPLHKQHDDLLAHK